MTTGKYPYTLFISALIGQLGVAGTGTSGKLVPVCIAHPARDQCKFYGRGCSHIEMVVVAEWAHLP